MHPAWRRCQTWLVGSAALGACFLPDTAVGQEEGAVGRDAPGGWREAAGANATEIRAFLDGAAERHGDFGRRAAGFLVSGMPESDLQSLGSGFLLENLDLALAAREATPWARAVPEEVFLNDVLPYASLDETREPWRRGFMERCREIVGEASSTSEAAQLLNRDFFDEIGVHYDTGRKAPNQSPSESRAIGKATCTGLSIILVNACRSVGVPARVAGIALWPDKRGNHTWVEVWDGGRWYYTGADEYDENGLDRGWFTADAATATSSDWRHAIWATSWKPTGHRFPMVWAMESRDVPGVDVTARYTAVADGTASSGVDAVVFFRLWNRAGGERVVGTVEREQPAERGAGPSAVVTRAGTADLNDMPSLELPAGVASRLRVAFGGETRTAEVAAPASGKQPETIDLVWSELERVPDGRERIAQWLALPAEERLAAVPEGALNEPGAESVADQLWEVLSREASEACEAALSENVVRAAGREMAYLEKSFGNAPDGERSLWVSLHGGGGTRPEVNDRQWENQIKLYRPKEGIVVAPRAPTDTWNLWHEGHIDALLDQLIADFVVGRGVDPNRVYLMGYSAGGDGVYQLAPRMADRLAAAAMMAGHPNDASPLGLRNLPFMIFMGADDSAYRRNTVAAEWGEKLAALAAEHPGGYPHKVTIYEGKGHWMDGEDQEALPWMAEKKRAPWPAEVVWRQASRTHGRFYWLAVPAGTASPGQTVVARVDGQRIAIEAAGLDQLELRLHDRLVDLDEPLEVTVNGEPVFSGRVDRSVAAVFRSLLERLDRPAVATAELGLSW